MCVAGQGGPECVQGCYLSGVHHLGQANLYQPDHHQHQLNKTQPYNVFCQYYNSLDLT